VGPDAAGIEGELTNHRVVQDPADKRVEEKTEKGRIVDRLPTSQDFTDDVAGSKIKETESQKREPEMEKKSLSEKNTFL